MAAILTVGLAATALGAEVGGVALSSPCMERDVDYFGNDLASTTRFWATARVGTKAEVAAMCAAEGGTLASIHSAAENEQAQALCVAATQLTVASGADFPCKYGCGCYLGLNGDGYGSWNWDDASPFRADEPAPGFAPPWVEWGNTANLETAVIMLSAGLPDAKAMDYGKWDDWATGESIHLGLCREDVKPGLFHDIASAEQCRMLCFESSECTHWTWRYHGACWLKNNNALRREFDWVSGIAGACPSLEGSEASAVASFCDEKDTDFIGHNLFGGTLVNRKHISVRASSTACKAHCATTEGCTHWTFRGWFRVNFPSSVAGDTATAPEKHGTCYLKNSDAGRDAAFVVSGTQHSVNCEVDAK